MSTEKPIPPAIQRLIDEQLMDEVRKGPKPYNRHNRSGARRPDPPPEPEKPPEGDQL